MNVVCAQVQIMWKDIAVGFAIILIACFVAGRFSIGKHKKILSQFYSNQWDGLNRKIERLLRFYDIFFLNEPARKNARLMYNGLYLVQASMALVNNDEAEFLKQINYVKREEEFELKPFILALYYCAKGDEIASKEWYSRYLKCERKWENIKIIMDRLFAEEDITYSSEMIKNTISTFKNPAITKLLSEVEYRLLPPED